ncbi:MAG: ribonuclease PH [Bdellovibrionales bacterium]|nr:ribonuclease PH [Bdellovibrionales bacterium]
MTQESPSTLFHRANGRSPSSLRPISFEVGFIDVAEGSVLISAGNTRVLCNASIEEGVPRWMAQEGKVGGWITGEYSMLPRSTETRNRRERSGAKGRTQEIQRLIGRALRASVDLTKIGEHTITVDCDVLQADGGTRTASITGGYVALRLALQKLINAGKAQSECLLSPVAAISVGLHDNCPFLDLDYREDVAVDVDANFVMNAEGNIIEVQGTAEGLPFSPEQFHSLLLLAQAGVTDLLALQEKALQ